MRSAKGVVRRAAWTTSAAPGPLLLAVALAACGGDADDQLARIECSAPELAVALATPFEWIEVRGVPEGFGPAVAEVGLPDGSASVLAPVATGREGFAALRVPIHPSFRIGGGQASVRIYSDAASCDPVPLTIAALEPAPGAMAEATGELRAALDEIVAPSGADGLTADLAELTESGGELPLLAIPALWSLPDLERLERLVSGDFVAAESPEDAEMLDAIAGRLELPRRMGEFRNVVLVVRELTGDLSITVPPPGEVRVSSRPDSASPFRFASHAPAPPPAGGVGAAPPTSSASSQACPEDRVNLFDIAEPEKLDNLMRAQDYAQRFLAGAEDEEGGSAAGTVFGDMGEVMSVVEYLGKHGEAVGEVWEAFSTVVLNSADAYASLLPGQMELTLTADPVEFEEDSEEAGTWTASAVATSDGMKLTQQVIEKVMETALEQGLADASIGKPLTEGTKAGDDVADKIDEKLIEKPTSAALDALLDAIGAEEGPDGFDIPGGCWSLDDMSASDAGAGAAAGVGAAANEGDAGGHEPDVGGAAPPLVTGALSGGAVEYVDDSSPAPREYEPGEAGTSRLEVRTVEGYRKTMTSAGGLSIGTTYAFGGDQYTAVTRITVNPIEIQLTPSIQRVEPGETVPFVATVRNAVDTRVRWTSSANDFDEIVDFGDGTHEAELITPENPEFYPIKIEVESVSRSGARRDGTPVRKAVGYVQLADPVIDIRPAGGCVSAGEERQFTAQVLGVGSDQQKVDWSDRGGPGNIDRQGLFRARGGEGTVTIEAAWAEDPEVTAEVDVRVEDECSFITFSVSGDAGGSQHAGLRVAGALGTDQSRHPQLEPGYCSVWINTDVQTGSPQPSISFTAKLRDRLRSENYLIGDDQTIASWGDERRSPGVFFAALGTESYGGIGASKKAHRFVSQGGTLSIEIDGDRIKGTFSVQFKEQAPFFDYPRQQMAHATGHFEGVLKMQGSLYTCPLPDDR